MWTEARSLLARMIDGAFGTPLVGAGLAVDGGGGRGFALARGAARLQAEGAALSFTPRTPIRFASVSKIATAFAAHALVREGFWSLDDDVSRWMGFDPRNPHAPDAEITLGMLLSHTSSIGDGAGYLLEPSMSVEHFLSSNADEVFLEVEPGSYFTYANLNYVLVGCLLERRLRRRFDEIVGERVLGPAQIGGGFEWLGVPRGVIQRRAAVYRWDAGQFSARIDAADDIEDGRLRDRTGRIVELEGYEPGRNPGIFSPHAGLRMSLEDGLALGRCLRDPDLYDRASPSVWRYDREAENGDRCERGSHHPVFEEYGRGLQILRGSRVWPSGTLLGHLGNAYGFVGGVWYDREHDVVLAYALNGVPEEHLREDLTGDCLFGAEDHLIRFVHDVFVARGTR